TAFAADAGNSITDGTASGPPIGGFIPKKLPAYIALALFGASAIIHWTQHFTITPRRPFMLTLAIGMTAMAVGFVLRIIYADPPNTLSRRSNFLFRYQPCLFLATDYILLARLVATFDKEVSDRCLLMRSSRIVKIFLWSDWATFMLQGNGGGLTANKNATVVNIGNKLVLAGLILQALSFLLFTCVLIVFGWRLLSRRPIDDWRILFYVMCITCIGISVRSVFRIAELAGGADGTIATHEGYFYLFDSLPLWISMTLYCFVWPVRALNDARPGQMELLKHPSRASAEERGGVPE
ncbi:RTA1 like protein-domain-containing protein, partial [Mycena epipterygia]